MMQDIMRCRPWWATAHLRPPPRLTQIILAIPCLVSMEDYYKTESPIGEKRVDYPLGQS